MTAFGVVISFLSEDFFLSVSLVFYVEVFFSSSGFFAFGVESSDDFFSSSGWGDFESYGLGGLVVIMFIRFPIIEP